MPKSLRRTTDNHPPAPAVRSIGAGCNPRSPRGGAGAQKLAVTPTIQERGLPTTIEGSSAL